MATTARTQKRRESEKEVAGEMLTQMPTFIGRDAEDAAHFWDSYEQAVVVVEDGDGEKWELDRTPLDTLKEWCKHVEQKRGWIEGPHVGGSLDDVLVRSFEG